MIAVVPVRAGELPAGADEAVAEAGGRALLIGDGVAPAAAALSTPTTELSGAEVGPFAPGAWAERLAARLAGEAVVVLAGSPDGRDLAPRLAHVLARPLYTGALSARPLVVVRHGGLVCEEHELDGPAVVTLVPGARGADTTGAEQPRLEMVDLPTPHSTEPDAELVELCPPDPATMDLSESPFIVSGGAGLGSPERFATLATVAGALGASVGGTRVVTDAGWLPFERQIGTTGVAVDPRLYVAFGISGAVQHTSGLGDPDHIISVNRDPSCPMMAMADLAIVADAPATLEALAARLGAGSGG